jgi:2-oxoglutarate ferredoxin oxidoreductase subunit beta
LLYVDTHGKDFHDLNATPDSALNEVPYEKLSPGSKGLEKILVRYR